MRQRGMNRVGRHELDHISIGSHPRLTLLATLLVKSIVTIKRRRIRITDVNQRWAQERSQKSQQVEAMQFKHWSSITTNAWIELTRHGARELDDRARFFDRLFLKENLDESKFTYLGDVLKLLDSPDYRNATLQF